MRSSTTSLIRPSCLAALLGLAIAGCRGSAPRQGAPSIEQATARSRSMSDSTASGQLLQFEDMLRNVPGVQITTHGTGFAVRIRGVSSLNGSGEPLYVVDGLAMQGTVMDVLQNIRPADVARIEVLRDAGATTYYGSRGANGVIVISLKKGRDR